MSTILPQQKLLLELLVTSGDIAVSEKMKGTILERTISECERHGWVAVKRFGAGFDKAAITDRGRVLAKEEITE